MENLNELNYAKDGNVISEQENQIISNIINDIVEKEGYKNYTVDTHFHSLANQGFLGTTCEVNIKCTNENGGKETNIFVKIMKPVISTFILVQEAYVKESFIYCDLAKMYNDLQKEFNVPEIEKYKMVKGHSGFPPTVIVLDNMKKRGYKTQHRSKIASKEFAELAVKELAKFHGLSFVVKEKYPDYFKQKITTLDHSLTLGEDWKNFVYNFIDIAMNYVDDDVKRKLEAFKTVFMEKYIMYMQDDKFKLCLCHGDFRPCNILIKETNGKVAEVIPIDYQLVYYGCPVMDLIYFIFAALDKTMRQNIPYLKDTYYKTLESFLIYFNVKVQDVFPREKFEFMYKERLDYGLQISVLMMPILMAPDEDLTDLDTMASMSHTSEKESQERMNGIFEDFIEWGYL